MNTFNKSMTNPQLGVLSKTDLKHIIAYSPSCSSTTLFFNRLVTKTPPTETLVNKSQAKYECKRRAIGYERISQLSGLAILACLGFVLLVKLIQ